MTAPLWLEEDRSEDFNHGGHGRAQNSRGRRPKLMGLAMEDAHVFLGTSRCPGSRRNRPACLNGVESKAAIRAWRRGRCVVALNP